MAVSTAPANVFQVHVSIVPSHEVQNEASRQPVQNTITTERQNEKKHNTQIH